MNILVTGGAGYIGSHTCVELLNNNHNVIIVDNLSNSSFKAIERIELITNKKVVFHNVDITDSFELEKVFNDVKIDYVIHFAGFKAVGESVEKPLMYYNNNIYGTISLLETMEKYKVSNIVFSSSATVYGVNNVSPHTEDMELSATNPYGQTKLMIEKILLDTYNSNNSWNITVLRYYNPIGAHESGLIGEDPRGIPNNLMPFVTQVAVGQRKELSVFGDDFDTVDGTGVRDYIHVVDLAKGHILAIETDSIKGYNVFNLGTGSGTSVLELINTFSKINEMKIPYNITSRRAGDIAVCYASVKRAKDILGFEATLTLNDMCKSSWNWQKNNPKGYN